MYAKRINFNLYLTPHRKINSESIADLNVKPKAINSQEKTQHKTCMTLSKAKISQQTPQARSMKNKSVNGVSSKQRLASGPTLFHS